VQHKAVGCCQACSEASIQLAKVQGLQHQAPGRALGLLRGTAWSEVMMIRG
jgi:hypothetical protein